MTGKILLTCAICLAVACATLSEPPPRTPAEIASAAVAARKDADTAAIGACLAYRAGVLTGLVKPSEKTDADCATIAPLEPECPAPLDGPPPEQLDAGPELREVPT